MAKKRKPLQSVNKMKPRGFVMHKLGGGENARDYHESMIDDGYHALEGDEYRTNESAANNLEGTGMNPPSPNDIENELRKRVPKEEEKEQSVFPYKSDPIRFVSPGMTPEATGSGFKMSMGSKENFSDSNFSSKDQSTISQAPSIMKDDWGGETIEMKDQGSPLNYGKIGYKYVEGKNTAAGNAMIGKDKSSDTDMELVNTGMEAAKTAASLAMLASDRRLKKDIKLVSVSPSGLKIYNFKYKDTKFGVGEFQGVMSDEIPYNAVVSHEDGFDRVDYSKLDVEFKAL